MLLSSWIARVLRLPFRLSRRQRRAWRRKTPPTLRPRLERLEDRTLFNVTPQPISVDPTGTTMGNSTSSAAAVSSMSANGQYEVFTSAATNLVNNITVDNGQDNVYLRNLKTGTTTLVDVSNGGTAEGNNDASSPVITADGRFVAFSSYATNLTSNDSNGGIQIYVRDMQLGVTYLVSAASSGGANGGDSSETPTIGESNSQLVVAYQSNAGDLVNSTARVAQNRREKRRLPSWQDFRIPRENRIFVYVPALYC